VNVGGFSAAILAPLLVGGILDLAGRSDAPACRLAFGCAVAVQLFGTFMAVRWWLRVRGLLPAAQSRGEPVRVRVVEHHFDRRHLDRRPRGQIGPRQIEPGRVHAARPALTPAGHIRRLRITRCASLPGKRAAPSERHVRLGSAGPDGGIPGRDSRLRGRACAGRARHHLGGSMPDERSTAGGPARVLLLGGASEIGLEILAALGLPADAEVLLAGRDEQRMAAAGQELGVRARTLRFDAAALDSHETLIGEAFAGGDVHLVISAAGVLTGQEILDRDPLSAGLLVEANFTGHVTTLLAATARMRAQGHGTIVVLSSIAAVRPRKANFVYGAAKAGLDAFGRGLADSLHGSGVHVLLVRPGFVVGRMTAGMTPAPLATTPAAVGAAVAARLRRGGGTAPGGLIWVPSTLAPVAAVFRLLPRPLWRRLPR
jgi:decaprenylphospho-beta-D-erythro-pentofuranosid-2-ulose 2-reductase